jgi:arabinofuranosyltransferase
MRPVQKVARVAREPVIYLIIAILVLLVHQAFYLGELGYDAVDDAYISFRYAQNFARGHGLVFNIGERVEGYTNFLWTVLLAPFILVGVEPGPVAMALGGLFALGTMILVYGKFAQKALVVSLSLLLLAVDGSFALWSVGGMETAIFTFLLLSGMIAYLQEGEDERLALLSGLIFALASLARPEGVLVFAVTLLHRALHRLFVERRLLAGPDLLRLFSFLWLYGPYFLWRYNYYGYLLPNTFYAKVATEGVSAQVARGFAHLRTFLGVHLGWLLIPLTLVPLLKRKVDFAWSYLVVVVSVYLSYIVYVGGDWSVGRFFVPILPPLYLLVAMGVGEAYMSLQSWLRRRGREGYLRGAGGFLALGGVVALFCLSSLGGEHELFIRRFQAREATRARVMMGRWLREHLPPDTFIAVDAAGQIPYYSGLKSLDMFGVNDEHTAHMKVETMGRGTPGHEKFDFDYIMWRRPDLIIVYGNFLDGSPVYERADDWEWTEDEVLRQFLTIYRRRDWEA